MKLVFVSDLHIGSPDDRRAVLFQRLIQEWLESPPTQVFLLGDIFDLWIADRKYFIDRYSAIIESLKKLKALGVEIHYFEGNHDLDLVPFWHSQLGFHVHERPYTLEVLGQKIRIEHGDEMDPDDKGYLFLRWLLRTPVLRWLGRHLPERVVHWIGERASQASREYTTHIKTVDELNVHRKIENHIVRQYIKESFQVLVSGHVHVREDARVKVSNERYVRSLNLGTWLRQPVELSAVIGPEQIDWRWRELSGRSAGK